MNELTRLFAEWLRRSEAVDATEELTSGLATPCFVATVHKEFLAFIGTVDIEQAVAHLQE